MSMNNHKQTKVYAGTGDFCRDSTLNDDLARPRIGLLPREGCFHLVEAAAV